MDLSKYYRPSLAVDLVVFGYSERQLSVLLIKRGIEPFKGKWALPGGFVRENESLEDTARRELREETGVQNLYVEQLYTFGEANRDPRGRVVSVAYLALVKPDDFHLVASTDASAARWVSLEKLPALAFDHERIIETGRMRLRNKIRYEPIGFELLPKSFTLSQLQEIYETVLETELDKRNFRKKILSYGFLKETDKKLENVPFRQPALYQFDVNRYRKLLKDGFRFDL